MSFIDTFINNYDEAVKRFFIGRVVDKHFPDINNLNDIVDAKFLSEYLNFLNDLPEQIHNDVSLKIWTFLLHLKLQNETIDEYNQELKKLHKKEKPNKEISADLKIVKAFKEIMTKQFKPHSFGKNIMGRTCAEDKILNIRYSPTKTRKDMKEYSIENLFELLDLVIDDLETKEFKFVGENSYFQIKTLSQNKLIEYLTTLSKEHNLKATAKIKDFQNDLKNILMRG